MSYGYVVFRCKGNYKNRLKVRVFSFQKIKHYLICGRVQPNEWILFLLN